MKPPLDLLLIHEEGTLHACIQEQNLVECTHVREEFLPASALKQALPAACVIKSHSQRAVYPPRLKGSWHWQGMRTQMHMHKHNLYA